MLDIIPSCYSNLRIKKLHKSKIKRTLRSGRDKITTFSRISIILNFPLQVYKTFLAFVWSVKCLQIKNSNFANLSDFCEFVNPDLQNLSGFALVNVFLSLWFCSVVFLSSQMCFLSCQVAKLSSKKADSSEQADMLFVMYSTVSTT